MKLRVRVNIGNRSMHRGDATPVVSIEDVTSGIRIGEITFTAADFGEMIAGNGFIEADMDMLGIAGYSNLNMKKELLSIAIPKSLFESLKFNETKENGPEVIDKYLFDNPDILPLVPDDEQDWRVWSYGFDSQQNDRQFHRISLCRYVPVKEERGESA